MIFNIISRFKKIIFIIFDLVFIGLAIFSILQPEKEYRKAIGTIIRIEEQYDSTDSSNDMIVYISYKAGGKFFNNVEYGAYDSSMKVGDKVNVYYEPGNPSFFQPEGYKTVPYVVLGIAVVFLLVTIFVL